MNRGLTRLPLASLAGWCVAVKLALVPPVVSTEPAEAAQDVLTVMSELSRWLDAIARYERGEIGPAVAALAEWSPRQLREVPRLVDDLNRFRDVDRLVKRGALLHLEVAMSGEPARAARRGVPPAFNTLDSRGEGIGSVSVHLQTARQLINVLHPKGVRDDILWLWYRTATAWLSSRDRLADLRPHVDTAVELFGRHSAAVLLDCGVLYESLAAPRVRAVVDRPPPAGYQFDVPSRRVSLNRARDCLERALALQSDLDEARLRLGRVLDLLGRHDEAVLQLGNVRDRVREPVIAYECEMFLGHAELARGGRRAARDHFEAARMTFPEAPSPLMALAYLASAAEDRAAARKLVQQALELGPTPTEDTDPWWTYHKGNGRQADQLVDELRRRVEGLGPWR